MEIQGVNTTRNDLFPFSALRVLGSLQIAIGAVCMGLGIVDLTMLLLNYDEQLQKYSVQPDRQKAFDTLVTMTVASAPIWCGTWYVVTGSLGTCVSRERSSSLKFMKIAFLVLSVLCAAFFAPACGVVSCMIAITRHTLDYSDLIWLVTTAAAFLSFCEMALAIVSASVCCCCAPLRLAKVHILFAESDRVKAPSLPIPRQRTHMDRFSHVPEPTLFRTYPSPPPRRRPPVRSREAHVQTDPPPPPPEPIPVQRVYREPVQPRLYHEPVQPRFRQDPRVYPEPEPVQPRHRPDPYPVQELDEPEPEPESSYPQPPRSSGSMGYDRLRKWALPHDDVMY